MHSIFIRNVIEVAKAVAPLLVVVCLLQVMLVQSPTELFVQFLIGAALVFAGMLLLFAGIDIGILPMGRFVGSELPKRGSLLLIIAVAFALGFVTTVAEPDVLVLAEQVDEASVGRIPGQAVLYVIAAGVAVFTAGAMVRVILGWSIKRLIVGAYLLALGLALFVPEDFRPLAFDSGAATTGVLTTPVVISLAVGLSSVLAGRNAVSDGFGVLGLASIGSVIAVLVMGFLWS
ncbi:MAG: DUF1538 domain-containing protein [Rhizobiaceae bacterium]